MSSFMEADSEYKLATGGKGVGRFSLLKAFSSVYIVSTYKEEDEFVTREFEFSLDKFDIDDVLRDNADEADYQTVVKLRDYKKDYEKEVPKQLNLKMYTLISAGWFGQPQTLYKQ